MYNSATLFSIAERLLKERRVPEALRKFRDAEVLGSCSDQCAAHRWTAHMLLGDFQSAWRESDGIDARGSADPHRLWDGQPFRSRHVLIRCLHGLGDTIQYFRYVPQILKSAATVTVEAQPALKRLFERTGGSVRIITWGDAEPHWDQQVEIVELPRIFRTDLTSIPAVIPYLHVPEEDRVLRPHTARVGLVWAAGAYNPARSIPLSKLRTIREGGINFVSLQGEPDRAGLKVDGHGIEDLYETSGCVFEAARTLLTLDLLITVDTMLAHLGGALGIPVWTLLPYEADWRWMLDRSDSPWYPSMRLFRQTQPGDWDSVVSEVREAIRVWGRER